jgi:hypothetical protein
VGGQTAALGIIRSDYMFHHTDTPAGGQGQGQGQGERGILQVELNTIASSFGCLSQKISDMHKVQHSMA